MRHLLCALAIVVVGDLPAHAQTDFSGTWRAENAGKGSWKVTLRVDGRRVTGRVSSCTSLPTEIYEGAVEGDSLQFKCKSLDGDRIVSLTGRLSGDQIAFTWQKEVRDGGSPQATPSNLVPGDENAQDMFGPTTPREFTARRVPPAGMEFAAAFNVPEHDLKVEGTLFVPPNVRRVRAVFVLLNSGTSWDGMGGAFYPNLELRQVAERLECAVLLPRFTTIRRDSDPIWILNNARLGAADGLLTLLARLAQESARPEIESSPLLLWAHSRTGHLAATFAVLHPDRTIALVRYHTGGNGLELPNVTLAQMPVLLVEARSDIESNKANGFRGEFAETAWKAGRSAGAPWTFGIEPDAVHQNPENLKAANALVLPWIAGVLSQRLSATGNALRIVADTAAWLGNVQTGEAAPFSSFAGSKREANWFPDEATLRGWRLVTAVTP